MALSLSQRWALVILKMISGLISFVASSIVIYHIFLRYQGNHRINDNNSDRNKRIIPRLKSRVAELEEGSSTARAPPQQPSLSLKGSRRIVITPFHRLLFGLSVMDVLYSFWSALSTIPVPANTGVVFGFGTTATCTAQGFFTQLVVSTPIYLASLSVYFLLKVRYNVSDDYVARYIEFWLHAIPWTVAIALGSAGIHLQVYNPISILEMGCWLSSTPSFCIWSPIPCERGYKVEKLSLFYSIFFSHGWLFVSFVVVLVCNMSIYLAIRKQERRNQMYLGSRLQQTQRNSSQYMGTHSITATTLTSNPNSLTQENNPPMPRVRDSEEEIPQPNDDESPIVSSSLLFLQKENDNNDNNIDDITNEENHLRTHHDRQSSSGIIQSRRRTVFDNKMKASRTALKQSILYVTTSFSTVIWISAPILTLELGSTNERLGYFFALMVNGVVPLQGLFTLIIFVRLDYLRRRQPVSADGCQKSRFQCVRECLFSPDIYQSNCNRQRISMVS